LRLGGVLAALPVHHENNPPAFSSTSATISVISARTSRWGWFPTGDVAIIDVDGFVQITDRSRM
jgi:acyl-CoA synthetase (AMP-forming)/AMP-acid ligase II